jgi:hypothetical protein
MFSEVYCLLGCSLVKVYHQFRGASVCVLTFLVTLSNLDCGLTFIPDSAPVMTSVLFARVPVVKCRNGEGDLYMMELVNRWLDKELRLGN